MKSRKNVSMMLLFALIALLVLTQLNLHAQAPAPAYVALDAVQLDQLVAPIALDPDSVVAQALTAATFPDQVVAADAWLSENMNLRPEERAVATNLMPWDSSVKGLIEFPAVVDNMARNSTWTAQLGNAYFNQPGDVMNAVQAMRAQAQESKVLVQTPQQDVVVEAGVISIVPVNPAVVFIPYYNPWRIWGPMFVEYPGFVVLAPPPGIVVGVGLAFDAGIPIGVFAGFDWGFAAWAPVWDGGFVRFHSDTYISSSVTVINHGHFGGHDRGAFEHGGRGVPHSYHAAAHAGSAQAAASHVAANRGTAGANRTGVGGQSASNRSGMGRRSGSSNSSFGNHVGSTPNAAGRSSFANRYNPSGNAAFAERGSSPAQSASNRSNFNNQGFGNSAGTSESQFGNRQSSPSQLASSHSSLGNRGMSNSAYSSRSNSPMQSAANRSSLGNRPGLGGSPYGNRGSSPMQSAANRTNLGNRGALGNAGSSRNYSSGMNSNRGSLGGLQGMGSNASRGNLGGRAAGPARSSAPARSSMGGGRQGAPARSAPARRK